MLLRNCCCCDLKGGAWAVGIVFLSLSVLELLGVLVGWGQADAHRSHYSYPTLDSVDIAVLAPLTVAVPLQLGSDALLLHGLRLLPTLPSATYVYTFCWLIFHAVLFGIASLGNLALIVSAVIMRYTGSERESVIYGGLSIPSSIIVILFWYAWVVVLSFYWQLRDSTPTGAPACRDTVQLQTAAAGTRPEAARPVEASAPLMTGDEPLRDQRRCQKCACAV